MKLKYLKKKHPIGIQKKISLEFEFLMKGECKSFLIETIDGPETPVPYIPYGIDRKDEPDAYVPSTAAYVPSKDAYIPSTVAYVPNAEVSTQAPKGNIAAMYNYNPQRIRP